MKLKKLPGFTFIEIMLVMGIFAIIVAFAFPVSIGVIGDNELEGVTTDLSSNIFKYQQYAYSQREGKTYGLKFYSDRYVLFEGNTYATATYTETITYPSSVEMTTINVDGTGDELIFVSGSFRPNGFAQLILTRASTDNFIDVNTEGLIDYYKL